MKTEIKITGETFKILWDKLPFIAGFTSGFTFVSHKDDKKRLYCIEMRWWNGYATDGQTVELDSFDKWENILKLLEKI